MKRKDVMRSVFCLILTIGLFSGFGAAVSAKENKITISAGSAFKGEQLTSQGLSYCLEEAGKRSGFKVEIKGYWSGSLAKTPEDLTLLSKGGIDTYMLPVAYYKDRMPLWTIANSLPLVTGDCWSSASAMYEYAKWKPAQEELKKNNLHFLFPGWYDAFIIMGKPVTSLADLKGYRVRPFGLQAKSFAMAGAVPVTLSGGEIMDAMAKGTLDGGSFGIYNFGAIEHYDEVSEAYSFLNMGAIHPIMAMNLKKYNSLPPAYKKALDEVCLEMVEWYSRLWEKRVGEHFDKCRAKGKPKLIAFPKAEQIRFINVSGKPVWEEIANEYEAKKLPGREAISTWVKCVKEAGEKSKRPQWPDLTVLTGK